MLNSFCVCFVVARFRFFRFSFCVSFVRRSASSCTCSRRRRRPVIDLEKSESVPDFVLLLQVSVSCLLDGLQKRSAVPDGSCIQGQSTFLRFCTRPSTRASTRAFEVVRVHFGEEFKFSSGEQGDVTRVFGQPLEQAVEVHHIVRRSEIRLVPPALASSEFFGGPEEKTKKYGFEYRSSLFKAKIQTKKIFFF